MTSGPQLTIESLIATPDRHLFAFEADRAVFATMDREAYRRSIFLDRRIDAAGPETVSVPVAALAGFVADHPPEPRANGWIFHIAHCGSTLLARALDRPDRSLVLREPLALRQLGVARAQSPGPAPAGDWPLRLRLASALYRRRYRSEAPALVKANVPVNFMLPELLGTGPAAPAILLYFPLRAYLLGVLRSPQHRQWVTNVTAQVAPALAGLVGGIEGSSVAERAAALWMAQMRLYGQALARFPAATSLDAEALFAAPRAVIEAAAAHLAIAIPQGELDAIAAGELFSTYSKAPGQPFDNALRLKVRTEASLRLGPEVDEARLWVERRLRHCPLPAALDRPLAGSAPPLLDG